MVETPSVGQHFKTFFAAVLVVGSSFTDHYPPDEWVTTSLSRLAIRFALLYNLNPLLPISRGPYSGQCRFGAVSRSLASSIYSRWTCRSRSGFSPDLQITERSGLASGTLFSGWTLANRREMHGDVALSFLSVGQHVGTFGA